MDFKKLALCAAIAGITSACGGDTDPPDEMDPETRWYVVSNLAIPEAEGTTAAGFNLDGVVSTGDGTSCVDLTPDYTSITDPTETGVDNALSTLVPQLGMLLGDSCPMGTPAAECLSALLAQQIAEGSVLLVMQISDIESYANDEDVTLQLYLGEVDGCDPAVEGSCAPMLSGSTIAPGQMFNTTAIGSVVTGSIVAGRLRAATPSLTISIMTSDLALDLVLRNAQIRANISATALTNGGIGGSLLVEDVATAAEMIMAGLGATVRSVLSGIADMEPQAAPNDDTCDALSAGILFGAVDVAGPGEPAAM